jgi:serine/threonine protein kinase
MVGTPLYMSAEILKGIAYTSKCDVWALGIIFYELLTSKFPWTGYS